jgi:hypothetical protein
VGESALLEDVSYRVSHSMVYSMVYYDDNITVSTHYHSSLFVNRSFTTDLYL